MKRRRTGDQRPREDARHEEQKPTVDVARESGEVRYEGAPVPPGWLEVIEHRAAAFGGNARAFFEKGDTVPGIALAAALNGCLGHLDGAKLGARDPSRAEATAREAVELALEYVRALRSLFPSLPRRRRILKDEGIRAALIELVDWCEKASNAGVVSRVALMGIIGYTADGTPQYVNADGSERPRGEQAPTVFVIILRRMDLLWMAREPGEAATAEGKDAATASTVVADLGSGLDYASESADSPTASLFAPVAGAPLRVTHAVDFSWMVVDGVRYEFRKPQQARVVGLLYGEWEKSGRRDGSGLRQATIADAIESNADRFRMTRVFEGNPALRRILRRTGKHLWALFLDARSEQEKDQDGTVAGTLPGPPRKPDSRHVRNKTRSHSSRTGASSRGRKDMATRRSGSRSDPAPPSG